MNATVTGKKTLSQKVKTSSTFYFHFARKSFLNQCNMLELSRVVNINSESIWCFYHPRIVEILKSRVAGDLLSRCDILPWTFFLANIFRTENPVFLFFLIFFALIR